MHEWLYEEDKDYLKEIFQDKKSSILIRVNAKRVYDGKTTIENPVDLNPGEHYFEDPYPHEKEITVLTEKAFAEHSLRKPLRDYEILRGVSRQGLIPYGLAIDSLTYSLGKNKDVSDRNVYLLPSFLESRLHPAIVLDENGEHESDTRSREQSRNPLEREVVSLGNKLGNTFVEAVRKFSTDNENIMIIAEYLKERYIKVSSSSSDLDRFGTLKRTKLEPYLVPWRPFKREAYDVLKKKGIRLTNVFFED